MIPKIMMMLFLSFIIGLSIGFGVKYTWENTAFKPYAWGEDEEPTVANCYGEDFSEIQIIRAISYWTAKGHNISFYEHTPSVSICENEYLQGFIILRKGGRFQMETKRFTSLETIKAAVITYRPGAQNLMWINEHELGHALGYAHYEENGHIMHPLYHKMSEKFWIP
jgi:hypothetical protein